jgi:hypothetical protein
VLFNPVSVDLGTHSSEQQAGGTKRRQARLGPGAWCLVETAQAPASCVHSRLMVLMLGCHCILFLDGLGTHCDKQAGAGGYRREHAPPGKVRHLVEAAQASASRVQV